jgi:hypothetical protein
MENFASFSTKISKFIGNKNPGYDSVVDEGTI